MRFGDGRSADSRAPARTIRRRTGQPSRAKSFKVPAMECQSPATERPQIKPTATRNPALLTPEATSRSSEMEDEMRQLKSRISQLPSSAPTASEAEKTFCQSDEPA